MKQTTILLAGPAETGALGVHQLKRLWSRVMRQRQGQPANAGAEAQLEHVVLDALGVGLEQTMQHLFQAGLSFADFEQWIIEITGGVSATQVARINAMVTGSECPPEIARWLAEVDADAPVLSAADLAFWDEQGYVIVPDAVPESSRAAATQAILDHVGAKADDPESSYKPNDHGIMVQFFQHPAFTANRQSRRIHKAFAQLWRTADLWVSTDRAGFNVPERPGWMFRGPDLHWDVSLARPIPFGTQGILYLTDTGPEQGAFTLVPGFHRRLDAWLDSPRACLMERIRVSRICMPSDQSLSPGGRSHHLASRVATWQSSESRHTTTHRAIHQPAVCAHGSARDVDLITLPNSARA